MAVAIGSLYLSTQRAFDYGSAQAYAQRQGTMIQEELQRRLQRAVDFAVTGCGSGTATASAQYRLPDGTELKAAEHMGLLPKEAIAECRSCAARWPVFRGGTSKLNSRVSTFLVSSETE